MNDKDSALRPWEALDPQAQIDLRIAYGVYLDGLPPTCSLATKNERFRAWLQAQGILWGDSPVSRQIPSP